jgi:hypothetical protein
MIEISSDGDVVEASTVKRRHGGVSSPLSGLHTRTRTHQQSIIVLVILAVASSHHLSFAYAAIGRLPPNMGSRVQEKSSGAFVSLPFSLSYSSFLGNQQATKKSQPQDSLPSRILWLRGGSMSTTSCQSATALSAVSKQKLAPAEPEMDESACDNLHIDDKGTRDFASMSIADILKHFQLPTTHTNDGFDSTVVLDLLKSYGANVLSTPSGKSMFKLVAEQFEDGLVQILVGVALLSGVFSFMEFRGEGDAEGFLLKAFVEPIVISSILGA